jgi:hypothetical protein
LLIPLAIGVYKALKGKDEKSIIFLCVLVALFAFVNTFLMQRVPDIIRYTYFMIIPILFISLEYLKGLKPLYKGIFAAVIIAAFTYPLLSPLQPDEYLVSSWLRGNTRLNDTILTAPTSLYTAVSERKVILREPITLATLGVDPKGHFSDLLLLYMQPSQDLVSKYGIKYVVLGKQESDFFYKYDIKPFDFSASTAFEPVYSHGTYTVYELLDAGALPKYYDNSLRGSLNFTSYSRWWSL